MNKAEITSKALTAALLGAILAGVVVIAAEQAVCFDIASGIECDASLGLIVILGVPASVFLIIFAVLLRNLPDQSSFEINKKDKK